MKRISNIFFSMQTMAILILVFAISLAVATFIENDFGTISAKAVVYNAMWFNILLLWLGANLVANIFRYKMYQLNKLPVFIFHVSFLIILLGSAITRFISYEGMMHIREGQSSNSIISDVTFVSTLLEKDGQSVQEENKVFLSPLTPKAFNLQTSIDGKKFRFKTLRFVPNASEIVNEAADGEPYIKVVVSYGTGRQTSFIKYNTHSNLGPYHVNFSNIEEDNAINIKIEEGNLFIRFVDTVNVMAMTGDPTDTIIPGEWAPFELRKLYNAGNISLVLTNYLRNGGVEYVPYEGNDRQYQDALIVEVSSGNESKKVTLRGGKGYTGGTEKFTLNDVDVAMTYGSQSTNLPFKLELVEFKLDRYPGSNSPSSYASEVILVDDRVSLKRPHRIFMNNVLNYGGYRFFQSSYDRDEKGTILSVNHDYWGTLFTYIGYALMALGMFLTPFSKSSRYALLGKKIKKNPAKVKSTASLLVLAMLMASPQVFGQHNLSLEPVTTDQIPIVNKNQAARFGQIMVQSMDGRLKPINTLANELLRKISRKSKLYGMNSNQVILGMISRPVIWQRVSMIKVTDQQLKDIIGIEGKYATYMDFIDQTRGTYKLTEYVQAAYAKKPAKRNMFDKDLMKVDERLNIAYMIYNGDLLKILPDQHDSHKAWYSPKSDLRALSGEDSVFVAGVIHKYLAAVRANDLQSADELINEITAYQKKYGADIMPSERKLQMEVTYNRMDIFNNLSKLYGLVGFVMLLLIFIALFRQSKALKYVINGMTILIFIGFVFQTAGLIMRWYISGHAPWSDGYESLIYIGWITMLAGLIFSHKSNMTLAATTVLTSIILMVAHLSWMDPEITNLVPVLKSYWLTIHVSIITASYGFLALGMLLGFLNLILMILKNKKNHLNIDMKIIDLTAINERTLMIGLYMLTIGTFLGGVWANESWGRYWGWDPKETWALVSVLVYSFILHMHYIPGLKNSFSFNFASLIGYGAILMTYFGVNYYLSGLHSYAAGDPVPVPSFVYYTLVVIILVAIWAYWNNRRFTQQKA